jgi:hypothetical protein
MHVRYRFEKRDTWKDGVQIARKAELRVLNGKREVEDDDLV